MDKPNIHISIEGFDGVGKTTICRLLTEKLGYEFVEKPLHFLFTNTITKPNMAIALPRS